MTVINAAKRLKKALKPVSEERKQVQLYFDGQEGDEEAARRYEELSRWQETMRGMIPVMDGEGFNRWIDSLEEDRKALQRLGQPANPDDIAEVLYGALGRLHYVGRGLRNADLSRRVADLEQKTRPIWRLRRYLRDVRKRHRELGGEEPAAFASFADPARPRSAQSNVRV